MENLFNLFAILIISLSMMVNLLITHWRWRLALIAIQYMGVYLILQQIWSIPLSASVLIAGWLGVAILGLAETSAVPADDKSNTDTKTKSFHPKALLFVPLGIIIFLVIFSNGESITAWLGLPSTPSAFLSISSIGLGMLIVSQAEKGIEYPIAWLTFFTGIALLYAHLDTSTRYAGLLAIVCLSFSLAGAYLITVSSLEAQK